MFGTSAPSKFTSSSFTIYDTLEDGLIVNDNDTCIATNLYLNSADDFFFAYEYKFPGSYSITSRCHFELHRCHVQKPDHEN